MNLIHMDAVSISLRTRTLAVADDILGYWVGVVLHFDTLIGTGALCVAYRDVASASICLSRANMA